MSSSTTQPQLDSTTNTNTEASEGESMANIMASFNIEEAETVQPGQFPLFGQLPTELRRKIWKGALPGPRVVEIFSVPEASKWSHTVLFGLRSMCRDACEVVMENYLCVPFRELGVSIPPWISHEEPWILLDHKMDTLYFSCYAIGISGSHLGSSFPNLKAHENWKAIAIPAQPILVDLDWGRKFLGKFTFLEKLYLVQRKKNPLGECSKIVERTSRRWNDIQEEMEVNMSWAMAIASDNVMAGLAHVQLEFVDLERYDNPNSKLHHANLRIEIHEQRGT